MVTAIRQLVPVKTLRRAQGESEYQPGLQLTARRFMGVLMHPVPRTEMAARCDIDRRGCKIIADWPATAIEAHPVRVGDLLEVGEQCYEIRGVVEHPRCYLEMYVDEV